MLNRDNTIQSIKNNKVEEHFGIKIQELSFVKKINLRFNPNNKKYMSSCGNILGTILPLKPNTYSKTKKVKVIWLGPDEWLIDNDDSSFLKLQNKTSDLESSVTDGKSVITVYQRISLQRKAVERIPQSINGSPSVITDYHPLQRNTTRSKTIKTI